MKKYLKKIKAIKSIYDKFRIWSVKGALMDNGLLKMYMSLKEFAPDISDQYTELKLDTEYLKTKVRALHAFQMDMVYNNHDWNKVNEVMDIGDSSGLHLSYLKFLTKTYQKEIYTISVNIDSEAVKKIRDKGMEAMCISAENICLLYPLIFMFEVLEHLANPVKVLSNLFELKAEKIFITVPYLKRSRIGMHHLRDPKSWSKGTSPENIHIFELSPDDWKLLFKHIGWKIQHEKIFYQYPKRLFLVSWLFKMFWRKTDFEGFYGIVLRRG